MIQKIQNFLTQKNKFETKLNLPIILVIILIDIFLIFNIFSGLSTITALNGSQSAIYPCQSALNLIADDSISFERKLSGIYYNNEFKSSYKPNTGLLSEDGFCQVIRQKYVEIRQDKQFEDLYSETSTIQNEISASQNQINNLEAQYNSTLLEKTAGQNQNDSINLSTAQNTKKDIQNLQKIKSANEDYIKINYEQLAKNPKIQSLLQIENTPEYTAFTKRVQNYIFWQPIVSFVLKAFYLIPIIAFSFLVNWFATKKNWQILAVISHNIFLLSFIPIVLQVFEFLQIGFLFSFLGNFLASFSQNLLFLLSYFYILLIPAFGYGFIVFLQKVVFNQKDAQIKRIQNNCCIKCNFRMKAGDIFCANCGTNQTYKCQNCSANCPIGLSYCPSCGSKKL